MKKVNITPPVYLIILLNSEVVHCLDKKAEYFLMKTVYVQIKTTSDLSPLQLLIYLNNKQINSERNDYINGNDNDSKDSCITCRT